MRDKTTQRHLSYLGAATIHQRDRKTEVSAALYTEGEGVTSSWYGRYWGLNPEVALDEAPATIRFHDATEAESFLVHVGRDSGRFRLIEHLRCLRPH